MDRTQRHEGQHQIHQYTNNWESQQEREREKAEQKKKNEMMAKTFQNLMEDMNLHI